VRTRIISDLHLGHSASRLTDPVMLAPILEEVDHLILAGDVWQQNAGDLRRAARQKYDALLKLVESRGITVEVLHGNHDPEGGKGVARVGEGAVLVTHGDALYANATPWAREMGKYRREVDAIIQKYESRTGSAEECAKRAKEIALILGGLPLLKLPPPLNFFATALWPPGRTIGMVRVWAGMGERGLEFLERSGEGAGVLVCGHFHRAGIWEKEGKLMVNTGSFMKGSRAWAVDVSDDKLTVRGLVLSDGQYVLGPVKGRWILRR